MTQKQMFLKNILDSTLSISLEHSVIYEKVNTFVFNDKEIKGNINKFTYKLSGTETDFLFDIYLYKVNISNWFGSDKSEYYLQVHTRKQSKYGGTSYVNMDYIKEDKALLEKLFNFLFNRIEEKRFAKEEEDYRKINVELVKLIDKSLTRDEKLKDLLKEE